MRQRLSFACEGATLAATLDGTDGRVGLLIVSGGNEIRIGAHRGMARLAGALAAQSMPVFRFDRRGIGDSEGENAGFEGSAADIAAAVGAFRAGCPQLERLIAFGNCDAASALALHGVAGIDALVLGNPWVVEASEDAPPPAAVKAWYLQRLRDPKAWLGLLTGAVNLRKLIGGLRRAAETAAPSSLAEQVARGIAGFSGPVTILIATHDGTAAAFADQWNGAAFARVRDRQDVRLVRLDSGSHSFAGAADHAALRGAILEMAAQVSR